MEYLVQPNDSTQYDWCVDFCICKNQCGVKTELTIENCIKCTTQCAGNCPDLCGGQFCTPVRADPIF